MSANRLYKLTDLASGDEIGVFSERDHAVESVRLAYPGKDLIDRGNSLWFEDHGMRIDFALEPVKVLEAPFNFN